MPRTPSSDETLHFRSCNLCEAMNGLAITHRAGRVTAIRPDPEDPLSRGLLCLKAQALAEVHDDPDRLRRPVRRRGADFEEISWDAALDEVEVEITVSDEVMPGVGCLPFGFGHGRPGVRLRIASAHPGASLNDLTDDAEVDVPSGTAVLNGTPVELAWIAPGRTRMRSEIDVAARLRAQLRILQRTWRPLVLGVLPVGFLLGWLVGASSPAKTASLVIGGAVLSLVGGAAAADQGFRSFAAGAPFLVVGAFTGVMLGRAGLSGVTLGSTFLFALMSLLGGVVGTLARPDDKR